MKPLSAIYGAVTAARNALYDRGTLAAQRLQGPVVSVGNISVGGSGKTPFVIWLGEQLQQRGVPFDVLSRGYRRHTRGVYRVKHEGVSRHFGDEPILIARRLGVPVIVGESRYAAGQFAEAKFGPQLHILDDGFQHRSLARDLDIVLLSSADLTGSLLPQGRLRESIFGLRRASVIVSEDIEAKRLPFDKPLYRIQRGITFEDAKLPAKPLAFCGIAQPQRFFEQLRQVGITELVEKDFPDHHSYSEADLQSLLEWKKTRGCDGFITTEKDAVNLGLRLDRLQPCAIARVTLQVENASELLDTIAKIVSAPRI
jgi:tetraacyldisaccharide 4'-kinase